MSLVLLPDWVKENIDLERQVKRNLAVADWLDQALKAFDPKLEVVWADERADDPRLTPARFHVHRDNSDCGVEDTYIAITGPNGEYREPDSGVIPEVQRRDMRNPLVMRELKRASYERATAAERADEAQRDQRVEQLAHDARAAKRVPGDGGLTKRKWGKK